MIVGRITNQEVTESIFSTENRCNYRCNDFVHSYGLHEHQSLREFREQLQGVSMIDESKRILEKG